MAPNGVDFSFSFLHWQHKSQTCVGLLYDMWLRFCGSLICADLCNKLQRVCTIDKIRTELQPQSLHSSLQKRFAQICYACKSARVCAGKLCRNGNALLPCTAAIAQSAKVLLLMDPCI